MATIKITSVSAIKDTSATINYTGSFDLATLPANPTLNVEYLLSGDDQTVTSSLGGEGNAPSGSLTVTLTAGGTYTAQVTLHYQTRKYTSFEEYRAKWSFSRKRTNADGTIEYGTDVTGSETRSSSKAAVTAATAEMESRITTNTNNGWTCYDASVGKADKISDDTYTDKRYAVNSTNSIVFYTHPGVIKIARASGERGQGWITEDESVLVCLSGIDDFNSKAEHWGKWYNQGVTNTLKPLTWKDGGHYLSAGFLKRLYASYGGSISCSAGDAVSASMFTGLNTPFNNIGEGKTVTAS